MHLRTLAISAACHAALLGALTLRPRPEPPPPPLRTVAVSLVALRNPVRERVERPPPAPAAPPTPPEARPKPPAPAIAVPATPSPAAPRTRPPPSRPAPPKKPSPAPRDPMALALAAAAALPEEAPPQSPPLPPKTPSRAEPLTPTLSPQAGRGGTAPLSPAGRGDAAQLPSRGAGDADPTRLAALASDYGLAVAAALEDAYVVPKGLAADEPLSAVLVVRVDDRGTALECRLLSGSGEDRFDEVLCGLVHRARVPAPPPDLARRARRAGVQVTFQYDPGDRRG